MQVCKKIRYKEHHFPVIWLTDWIERLRINEASAGVLDDYLFS